MQALDPLSVPGTITILLNIWPAKSIEFFYDDIPDMPAFQKTYSKEFLIGRFPSSDLNQATQNLEPEFKELFGNMPITELLWRGENCGKFSYLIMNE